MSGSEHHRVLSQQEWDAVVYAVLADHPDWLSTTVNAMQAGVAQAVERQRDRVATLSMGLHQALSHSRDSGRRDSQQIIDSVKASTLHPTKWSAWVIEREEQIRDRKKATPRVPKD